MYRIVVQDHWWRLIGYGYKTVEARLNRGLHSDVEIGDRFQIINGTSGEILTGEIHDVLLYPTFRDMLENEGIDNVTPGINTVEEAVNIYLSIPGYRDEERLGVIAIRLLTDD